MERGRLISVRTDVAARHLIEGLLDEVLERERGENGGDDLEARVHRAGYLARVVETERFEAARGPIPPGLNAELAWREPAGRPDPDDEAAVSWRVPGPGGHVRHYLAIGTARVLAGDRELSPDELARLKRVWLHGFLSRCCEETVSDTGTTG